MKHIPTRNFSRTIDFTKRFEIIEKYEGTEWDYVKQFLSRTQQITASALKVSEVIDRHFDIKLFPSIFKVAGKGFDAAGGTAYFSMYGKNSKNYIFWNPAKDFKSINGKYYEEDGEFYRDN